MKPSSSLGAGESAKVAAPPTHFIRGEGSRKTVRALVDWWAARYPKELQNYVLEVAINRQSQSRSSGMSDGGNLRAHALMPTRVFLMGEKMFGAGFWKEQGYKIWDQEFEAFRIKKPK